jgi:hypothetical protein
VLASLRPAATARRAAAATRAATALATRGATGIAPTAAPPAAGLLARVDLRPMDDFGLWDLLRRQQSRSLIGYGWGFGESWIVGAWM